MLLGWQKTVGMVLAIDKFGTTADLVDGIWEGIMSQGESCDGEFIQYNSDIHSSVLI